MSQPAKVLIVDDEELIRLNLRALLEDLGYRVAEAAETPVIIISGAGQD